ncbi:hypothetical protein KKI24_01770 [bacterium]|nr:hypothetical protein [bacterium]
MSEGKKLIGVKDDDDIRRLQEIMALEVRRAIFENQARRNRNPYLESRFIIDQEIYKIARYVERERKELIYLEMFVFEQRFVRPLLEARINPSLPFVKPVTWSRIRNLRRNLFTINYDIPPKLVDQWKNNNTFLMKQLRKEGGKILDDFLGAMKSVPHILRQNLVQELYFRGYLEAQLWICELEKQVEHRIEAHQLKNHNPCTVMGFFKDMSLDFSMQAFDKYRAEYRDTHYLKRTSGNSFLPVKARPLNPDASVGFWYVFTEPELWKNFYGTDGNYYLHQNRTKIFAETGTFLDWDKPLWPIKCLKEKMGRSSAIINYISWQSYLAQKDQQHMETDLKRDQPQKWTSYISRLIREVNAASLEKTVIDSQTRRLLCKIAHETGFSGLSVREKERLLVQIKRSKKVALSFYYARILDNERVLQMLACEQLPLPERGDIGWDDEPQNSSFKKSVDQLGDWVKICGELVLLTARLVSPESSSRGSEVVTPRKIGYIRRREISGWQTCEAPECGFSIRLHFPKGEINQATIGSRRNVAFLDIRMGSSGQATRMVFYCLHETIWLGVVLVTVIFSIRL